MTRTKDPKGIIWRTFEVEAQASTEVAFQVSLDAQQTVGCGARGFCGSLEVEGLALLTQ